jgi:hypothetical protein
LKKAFPSSVDIFVPILDTYNKEEDHSAGPGAVDPKAARCQKSVQDVVETPEEAAAALASLNAIFGAPIETGNADVTKAQAETALLPPQEESVMTRQDEMTCTEPDLGSDHADEPQEDSKPEEGAMGPLEEAEVGDIAAPFAADATEVGVPIEAGLAPAVEEAPEDAVEAPEDAVLASHEPAVPSEYHSGIWLFTDRENITHFFKPNFLPPYDTPEKKRIILDVLREEWDEKTLSWKAYGEGSMTKRKDNSTPAPGPATAKASDETAPPNSRTLLGDFHHLDQFMGGILCTIDGICAPRAVTSQTSSPTK